MLFYPLVNAYIWLLNNGAFLYYMCHLRPEMSWKGNPFVVISCLPRKVLKLIPRGACWEVGDATVSGLQSPVQNTFPLSTKLPQTVSHTSSLMPAGGAHVTRALTLPFYCWESEPELGIRTRVARLFLFYSRASQNAKCPYMSNRSG